MMLGSEAGSVVDPSQIQGEFQDFIGVYRKFVNKQLCLQAIQEFELLCTANEQLGGLQVSSTKTKKLQQGSDQFPQGKLGRNDAAFTLDDVKVGLSAHFYQYINAAFENYRMEYDQISRVNLGTIGLKIQRTQPGGGYHTWHYESSSYKAANRELAWMIYLNDMPDGEAETEFLYQKRRIKPETGTLLIWPAGMTHVHRGNTVFTKDKYILTGWYFKLP